jgi:hypothetical protein
MNIHTTLRTEHDDRPLHGLTDVAAATITAAWERSPEAEALGRLADAVLQLARTHGALGLSDLGSGLLALCMDLVADGARLGFALGRTADPGTASWDAWLQRAERELGEGGCEHAAHRAPIGAHAGRLAAALAADLAEPACRGLPDAEALSWRLLDRMGLAESPWRPVPPSDGGEGRAN